MIKVFQCEDEGYGRIFVNDTIKKDYPNLDRDMDYFHIDANLDSLQTLVDEALTMSFTGEDKVILLTGCDFLSQPKKRGGPNKDDIQAFIKYLKNPSDITSIYILVDGKVQRGELLNSLKKVSTFLDITSPSDSEYIGYGQKIAAQQNKAIDREACILVKDRVGNDFRSFINNVKLLLEYSSNVSTKDVNVLVKEPLQDNTFDLCDLLLNGDVKSALALYRDLIKGGRLPLTLLPMLLSQLRFLFEVSYLKAMRMDKYSMAQQLNCKPGRVGFAMDKLSKVSSLSLLKSMADLSKIEKEIKFELDDADMKMELYILNFTKYLVR